MGFNSGFKGLNQEFIFTFRTKKLYISNFQCFFAILSHNINQQNANVLKYFFLFLILSLVHVSNPSVHLQEDGCMYRYGMAQCVRTHWSTYKTSYSDACKPYPTITVYTTFDIHGTVHRVIFLDAQFSSLLNITLHVSDGLSVHHQEFKTLYTASGICLIGQLTACQPARDGTRVLSHAHQHAVN